MRRALPLILAIAAFFIAGLIWISSNVAGHAFPARSALNTSPQGCSLAFAYLSRHGMANMLTTPMRDGAVPANAIVFRIDSFDAEDFRGEDDEPDDKRPKTAPFFLATADEEFVRKGGRLVLANGYLGGGLEMREDAGKAAVKVFPLWPGIETISIPEPHGVAPRSMPRAMHTIFAGNGEAVVARQPIGAGDAVIISAPEIFENEHLAADHHLALLIALADTRRPVYFDEYAHGIASDDGALALMTEWRLGPLLVLAGIAALFTFWRNAWRIGPADAEERDTRSDAIDLVASLGALYDRSMTNGDAIALYRAALERTVAAQSGLRGDALHRRVADLTQGLTPATGEKIAAHAFDRHLQTINDAFRTLERTARGGQHANHR
jgi:hypothetical protein